MSELHDVEPSHIDELITKTKHLRDCANHSKRYLVAEKLHKVVKAWESVTEALLKRLAAEEASGRTETTLPTTPAANGHGNNVAGKMGQTERKFVT